MRTTGASSPGIKIKILGIGEITTTIEVEGPHWYKIHPTEKRRMRLAYKRMPAFDTWIEADSYMFAHQRYQELLGSVGIAVPWHDNLVRQRADGRWVVYNRQERYVNRQVACLVIRELSREDNIRLFERLLAAMRPLFVHNLSSHQTQIGFDGQIPNWVLTAYDPDQPETAFTSPLVYIDTSTPLYRIDGAEQMNMAIFLKSVPLIFRPLLRYTLLPGIVQRYYEPREVVLDLAASYITHGRPDVAGELTELANGYLKGLGADFKPLTPELVRNYNSQDVLIWKFFRSLKRVDRFLTEKVFKRRYEQRLPPGSPSTWENLVGAGGQGLTPEEESKK